MFLKRVDSQTVMVGAPAKINLYLDVLGRRGDGFHDIDSIFQAVSLFDRLKFKRRDLPGVSIAVSPPADLPTDGRNLIARAFALMADQFGLDGGLEVELEKNIPIAAGLAGGSADGAATILATAALFDLPVDFAQMAALSAQIGSDLPFFFSGGQAQVTGRGEIVTELDLPLDYWLILVTPNLAISTGEAYAALKLPLTKETSRRRLRRWKTPEELANFLADTGNDFEEVIRRSFPQMAEIKAELLDKGALLARLSGSGPTVYGIYREMPELIGDRAFLGMDCRTAIVRPVRLPARI